MTWRAIWWWPWFAGLGAAPAEPYVEPHFERPVFEVQELELDEASASRIAGELVKAAYFLADRPLAGAKSLAVAHALVPRHSGAMVANFRLRSGKAPEEAQMIDPDEVAALLADTAARLRDLHPSGNADQAVACLVEVALSLPVLDAVLREKLSRLDASLAAAADWSAAFPDPSNGKNP